MPFSFADFSHVDFVDFSHARQISSKLDLLSLNRKVQGGDYRGVLTQGGCPGLGQFCPLALLTFLTLTSSTFLTLGRVNKFPLHSLNRKVRQFVQAHCSRLIEKFRVEVSKRQRERRVRKGRKGQNCRRGRSRRNRRRG